MDAEVNVDEVVELVLAPFNDIVAKAQNAAANAAAEDAEMYKAAESLGKEGQRALNRLHPLYQKMVKQHGVDCVDAIKRNEDIGRVHLELTDMLWEFDDYLSVESFDASKYAELQALCRKLAPKMYNVLVRMNVELLARASTPSSSSASSSSTNKGTQLLHLVPESPPTSPMFLSSSSTTDAWHHFPSQSSKDGRGPPPHVLVGGDTSWGDINSVSGSSPTGLQRTTTTTTTTTTDAANHDVICSPSSSSFDLGAHAGAHAGAKRQSFSSGHSSPASSNSLSSRGFSLAARSIVPIRERGDERHQPPSQHPWSSRAPHRDSPTKDGGGALQHSMRQTLSPHSVSGMYVSDNLRKRVIFEHAAMPASNLPSKQCIITELSSFRRYKGFCLGAQEVLQGKDGVKQKHKPAQRTLSRVVAKCNGCSMELDYSEIETDLTNKEAGNLTKKDVGYRLRFLQKSHLPVKRSTDTLFGCMFCVSNGFTVEESDATVFFSADDLFTHLSRHPRPLPSVPGTSVIYGVDMPSELRNNYDLHFQMPPRVHPIHEVANEIDGRPTGIAVKETRRADPLRKLGERDHPEELQLAVGARVVGIKWPPQYKGRKIFAWQEGSFASVPSENIMLIPPERTRLTRLMSIRSRASGKAKWKFCMKSSKELPWLKFDKGDVITNIGWEHPDHWCWCGLNSKGSWGIFPQAYIDPNTVVDNASAGVSDGG